MVWDIVRRPDVQKVTMWEKGRTRCRAGAQKPVCKGL